MFDLFRFIIQESQEEELGEEQSVALRKRATTPIPESEPAALDGDGEGRQGNDAEILGPAVQMELWPGEVFSEEVIRSEVNFLVLPFFALSRRDASQRSKTEYHATVKRGDATLDVYWGVHSHPRYGYPRPFDGQVHKAIEQVISQLQPPIENPVPLGSLYRIVRLLELKDSGRVYQDIKAAIQRTVATVVESKGTFYRKGTKRWLEDTFHLYERVVFAGEVLPGGEIADSNYLFLGSWYLENINARHVKPLDYTYYRSLRSRLAARLYELLGVKFYGMGSYPYIRYRYSTLCQILPLTRQRKASNAKQNLQPGHLELTRSDFLFKVEWGAVPGETRDWYVTYWPGPRAKAEIRKLPRQLPLRPHSVDDTNDEIARSFGDQFPADQPPAPPSTEPPKRVRSKASRKKAEPDSSELTDTQQELLKEMGQLGVSQVVAEDLVRDSDPQALRHWITLVKDDSAIEDRPAYLVKALRDEWQLPESFLRKEEALKDTERQEEERRRREKCSICQGRGLYQVDQNTVLICHHTGRKRKGSKRRKLDTEGVWNQVLEKLYHQIPGSTYEGYLKDTILLGLDGNTAIVQAPSSSTIAQLDRIYGRIARTLGDVLSQGVEVMFITAQNVAS